MKTQTDAKKELRTTLLKLRESIDSAQRMEYGKRICQKILDFEPFQKARLTLSFLSTSQEVDMSYFDLFAQEYHKAVAYPVIRERYAMDAYLPSYYGAFETNRFQIREPVIEKSDFVSPDQIDLVIVPMLGFDEHGMRIGYGGGYYDRYLARATEAFKLGVCYEQGKVRLLPADETDVKMDAILTQDATYYF